MWGTVTRLWARQSGSDSWLSTEDFSLLQNIKTDSGAQLPSYSMCISSYYVFISLAKEWSRRKKADSSPPPFADVKN